jgi:hypothetical protein
MPSPYEIREGQYYASTYIERYKDNGLCKCGKKLKFHKAVDVYSKTGKDNYQWEAVCKTCKLHYFIGVTRIDISVYPL